MSRDLRIEFPGAVYHVMARGNSRAAVFLDEADRDAFLRRIAKISERLRWRLLSYCLMTTHYHLVLETPEPNLARGMRDLNGVYAQHFNRQHDHVGHVFQGRYRAIVVQRGSHLLELMRYVVLNPVRAGFCSQPDDWPWSSHRAVLGHEAPHPALDRQAVLAQFAAGETNSGVAYERFVLAGMGLPPPVLGQGHPLATTVSGSSTFRTRVVDGSHETSAEVPRRQRTARQLTQYLAESRSRNAAIRAAYASGHHTLVAIGYYFGLHYSTISKICREGTERESLIASRTVTPVVDNRRFKM